MRIISGPSGGRYAVLDNSPKTGTVFRTVPRGTRPRRCPAHRNWVPFGTPPPVYSAFSPNFSRLLPILPPSSNGTQFPAKPRKPRRIPGLRRAAAAGGPARPGEGRGDSPKLGTVPPASETSSRMLRKPRPHSRFRTRMQFWRGALSAPLLYHARAQGGLTGTAHAASRIREPRYPKLPTGLAETGNPGLWDASPQTPVKSGKFRVFYRPESDCRYCRYCKYCIGKREGLPPERRPLPFLCREMEKARRKMFQKRTGTPFPTEEKHAIITALQCLHPLRPAGSGRIF